MNFHWRDISWHFVNLSHRTDRLLHINNQLDRAGIKAERFEAFRYRDYHGPSKNIQNMVTTPNTIGNWLSVTALMRKAADTEGVVGLLEDDALLCSDFAERLQYIEDNYKEPWDIFFLGATVHVNEAPWHPELGMDCEPTDVRHIWRTYGAFSNQGMLINGKSAEKVLGLMEKVMPDSRGSDHALIQVQPELQCYCFIPGLVFQIDGQSDIGKGWTKFSNFLKNPGPHVWCDKLDDFDYDEFIKKRKI